jgi:hypothetical protein
MARRRNPTEAPLEVFIYDVAGSTFEAVGREIGVAGTTVARIARGEIGDIRAKTYEAILAWADRVARERNLPPSSRLRWTLKGDNGSSTGAAA